MISASHRRPFASTLTCWLASVGHALAQNLTTSTNNLAGGSIIMSSVRMLGALAMVLAVFAAGLWLFKNWQRFVRHKGQTARLNILEVKSIGPRQALYVVGYERQRLLLASSSAGITMLTTLPSAGNEASDDIVIPQPNFTDALTHALHRKS